mgnify:CR=1 FL=1
MSKEDRKHAEDWGLIGGDAPSVKPRQNPPPYIAGMFEGLGFTVKTAKDAAQNLRAQAAGLRGAEGSSMEEDKWAEHILLTMLADWLRGWTR